jgi:adenylate cyclase
MADRGGPREIERKFLVSRRPDDCSGDQRILQGYLPIDMDEVEVRVRRKGDEFLLTIKRGHGLSRDEDEVRIDQPTFDALWPLTAGRRIEKTRSRTSHNGFEIEIDEYHADLGGLIVAEVEFDSEEAAAAWEPPQWLGEEKTGDPAYANRALAEGPQQV